MRGNRTTKTDRPAAPAASRRTIAILIGVLVATLLGGGTAGCRQAHEVRKSGRQLLRGETELTVRQPPLKVEGAIDAALADARLTRIGAATTPLQTTYEKVITARDAQDTKVMIAYRPGTDGTTRVIVSTGVLGPSDLRERVWDAVRIRLGLLDVANGAAPSTTRPAPSPAQAAAR
ncbi:MAG TPA: hypothetical protein VER17_10415 [Tepidisphaeraceae bacterium]|nr:hypothetical protein [Tepidisphaeraceae bacterium]